jgi:signal transduction histidine kinase
VKFEHRVRTDLWNKKIQTHLYRIFQEAIHNIVKHSGAKQGYLRLTSHGEDIYLSIQDDGIGFRPKIPIKHGGHGLHNIHERVNLLNGSIDIKSAPGKGTLIQIKVPLHQ